MGKTWRTELLDDWGVEEWTVPRALQISSGHGSKRKHAPIMGAAHYVDVCRRVAPEVFGHRHKCSCLCCPTSVDGRLIAVGYNHASPTQWSSEFYGFLDYWRNAVDRPDRVGSDYNPTPEAVYRAWRGRLPPGFVRRSGSVLGPALRMLHRLRLVRWDRDKLRIRDTKRTGAVCKLLLTMYRKGLLGTTSYGDLKRLCRFVSLYPEDFVLRWAILRVLQDSWEDLQSWLRTSSTVAQAAVDTWSTEPPQSDEDVDSSDYADQYWSIYAKAEEAWRAKNPFVPLLWKRLQELLTMDRVDLVHLTAPDHPLAVPRALGIDLEVWEAMQRLASLQKEATW